MTAHAPLRIRDSSGQLVTRVVMPPRAPRRLHRRAPQRPMTQKRALDLDWYVYGAGLEHRTACGRAEVSNTGGLWRVTVDRVQLLDLHGRVWARRNVETARRRAAEAVTANGPTRWERAPDNARNFVLRGGPFAATVVVDANGAGDLTIATGGAGTVIALAHDANLEDALDLVLEAHERRLASKRGRP